MKLLSIVLISIINICFCATAVSASEVLSNGYFKFQSFGTFINFATIVGLESKYKNDVDLIIPAYINHQGTAYKVSQVSSNAFVNEKFETVIIPSNVDIYLFENAFKNCKNLKKIIIDGDLSYDKGAFSGSNNIEFEGPGLSKLVERLSKNLLEEWKIPINQNFEGNSASQLQNKRKSIYNLAKKINEKFPHSGNSGNLGYSLVFQKVNHRGMSRLFRQLAITMGIKPTDIFNAADGHCSFWNYVRIGNEWYNVDVYTFDFKKYSSYTNGFFFSNKEFSNHLVSNVNYMFSHEIHTQPNKWIVYDDQYGTDGEIVEYRVLLSNGEDPNKVKFDDYIKDNKLGGTRV
ncbi:hypothetical protein PIROE2DRAFT_63363 [Piromyces sp. E2]|nr:hypothetical protein PIROE2DRAFT_63363 [Piromyces sp. E2]|eukprot:OUM60098.1 hypothetical protein PIROE2DRAFT_63363 [Piromyces sp. E2]